MNGKDYKSILKYFCKILLIAFIPTFIIGILLSTFLSEVWIWIILGVILAIVFSIAFVNMDKYLEYQKNKNSKLGKKSKNKFDDDPFA